MRCRPNPGCAGLLVLALIAGAALPARAGAPQVGPVVTVTAGNQVLSIAGRGVQVRVAGNPLRIGVVLDAGRPPLQSAPEAGPVVFSLDARQLARLAPGKALPAAGSSTAVHLRTLLRWTAIPDGASLTMGTDDPLGRQAQLAISVPDAGLVRIVARLADGRAVAAASMAWQSGPDEHFFGLGEQFGGVDQRGRTVGVLAQDGMTTVRPRGGYAPAAFFVSSRGYGFYLTGTQPSVFGLDAPSMPAIWQATAQATGLDCYLLGGPRPPDVLARYAALTGHPPMPPPWALGVWKTAIGGQARVLAEAQHLRRAGIPVSVIWSYDAVDEAVKLGWPYEVFGPIPPGAYPDLPGFTAGLHREGFQVLGYLTPEFTRSRPGFAYPAQHGYFVRSSGGHIYLLDLTNPAALAWWKGLMQQILARLGFDGWLLDLGDRFPPGPRFADGRSAADLTNVYPLLLAQVADEVVRSTKPDALSVMRSGFAGAGQYQPAVWAGDQGASWDPAHGFPAVIPAGMSWGISGAPFWGSDIGGFLDGGLRGAAQEELWMRWLEFGALSPIMRDQLGRKGYEAIYLWSNGRTVAAFRFYARLHQSLFPYLYAAAQVAHQTGLPIMRHLFLAYPDDPNVYTLDDEYLLGPDLLVAPVITPGAADRSVYLPSGSWIDYWTGQTYDGGRRVSVPAPLDRIPLLVRGGALLPTLAEPGDTLAPASDPGVHRAGDDLRLRLYPGGPGETVILADGTRLVSASAPGGLILTLTGPARRYTLEAPFAAQPAGVQVDGHETAPAGSAAAAWRYDPRSGLLQLSFQASAGTHTVVASLR